MFIIKHFRKDDISDDIDYRYGYYLCKLNGCNDSFNRPIYDFCQEYDPVYFKQKWHAYMYLSRYYANNNCDEYCVTFVDDKITPKNEVFDPTLWQFVEPDEYYQELQQYRLKLEEMLVNVEAILSRYDQLDEIVNELKQNLKREFFKRPDKFSSMWLNGSMFDMRRKNRSHKLFAEIFELIEKRKNEINELQKAKTN